MIKLHWPFIFPYCIAVNRGDTLRPPCAVRNCMHKSRDKSNIHTALLF